MKLAEIFNVSLDDLINFKQTENSLKIPPKGKHAFGVVTVGDKGQITLPVKARKVFNINPGDNLILLGDEQKGIAVIKEEEFLKISKKRRQEIDNIAVRMDYRERICKNADGCLQQILELHENTPYYGVDLPIR